MAERKRYKTDRMVHRGRQTLFRRHETSCYPCRNAGRLTPVRHRTTCPNETAHHSFAKNDFGRIGYAVCYGMHGERFIVWEPDFGPMQYWPKELNTLWIKGICMTLFPTPEFSEKADYHLKWWELYDWSKKCKRKLNRWWDYWSVEIFPLFRW